MLDERLFLRNLLRAAWWFAAASLIIWIAARNLPMDGVLRASTRPGEADGFIGGLQPTDRVALKRDGAEARYEILDEPVYLTLAAPKLYRRARVTLQFVDDGQPVVEIGGRTHAERWEYDLRTLDAPMLDRLGWSARQDGTARIYERKATARSAAEVLAASGAERIGIWRVDAARWGMRLPKTPEAGGSEARGADLAAVRTVYLYVQEGPLEATLEFEGAAPSAVRLEWRGRTILTRTPVSAERSVGLELTGAEPGLYRIEIEGGESARLAGIRSRQRKLAYRLGGAIVSPDRSAEFSPEFPMVRLDEDLAARYDTIVATYAPPAAGPNGSKVASAEFDLSALARIAGRAQLAISVPAIKSNRTPVRIERIDVEYLREPFVLGKLWQALKNGLRPSNPTL